MGHNKPGSKEAMKQAKAQYRKERGAHRAKMAKKQDQKKEASE